MLNAVESTVAPSANRTETCGTTQKNTAAAVDSLWLLCGRAHTDASLQEIAVSAQPFTIGRRPDNSLCLANSTVSGRHAELLFIGPDLYMRDLQSTNGTLVNGDRVGTVTQLKDGDTVHFGTAMFTVRCKSDSLPNATITADIAAEALAHLQFDKLLSVPALLPYFQPIVRLNDWRTVGYEVLARSRLIGLEFPARMFRVAAERGSEAELSCLSRRLGLSIGRVLNPHMELYLNTHPVELASSDLFNSLEKLREEFPDVPVVLEVHEASVTSPQFLLEVRKILTRLNVKLAYDDFGAGQNRLSELAEVPPDVLKFDMKLIQGISEAPAQRRELLASLIRMVRNLNAIPLAEGIETVAEATTCRELGFELAQGFLFGQPSPATSWVACGTGGSDGGSEART